MHRKTNGVFTTLDSVMREKRGTWIAWSEREADAPFTDRVRVPAPDHPEAYDVRRIGLSPEEARSFYYDFTSSAIWPVLFSLLDRARFTQAAWETYQRVNEAFAETACEEAAPGAVVWVNDFHLMLTPVDQATRLTSRSRSSCTRRSRRPTSRRDPVAEELLDGLCTST